MRARPSIALRFSPAFTLIELVVVMAMMAAVVSLVAPSLAKFFKGRDLDSEANRFLAVIRYGQNQAVEFGVPMTLWVDRQARTYGLRFEYVPGGNTPRPMTRALLTSQEPDNREPAFELAEDLSFEIPGNTRITNGLATIRFLPDGYYDEYSFPYIFIKDRENHEIPIAQARNRMKYELADLTNRWWMQTR